MRPGIVVSIGLEKSTKLGAVFRRYVEFCNETSSGDDRDYIDLNKLEFSHCQLLNPNDTAETSALMKNDRILVRKDQNEERSNDGERKRTQREADRVYFQQMRQLMLGGGADIILDCKGKLLDKHGRNQRVLSTSVRGNAAIIARRCPWLGNIIQQAREKARMRVLQEEEKDVKDETPDQIVSGATEIEDEDDYEESLSHEQHVSDEIDMVVDFDDEDDEDDELNDEDEDDRSLERASAEPARVEEETSEIVSSSRPRLVQDDSDLLVVTIPHHSPEAMKLLLEYCCTNRVAPLGRDAFIQSCKTRPTKLSGPVPPYHSSHHTTKWPNGGFPRVEFYVALAGIKLAEEAGMHRLSLMCEVAAAQLVTTSNVAEALSMSTSQKAISGNDLLRLRKAAMEVVLRRGERGVIELSRSGLFNKALQDQRSLLVPALLQGTMETVSHWDNVRGVKRDNSELQYFAFDELDRLDFTARERERKKRRRERTDDDDSKVSKVLDVDDDESFEDPILGDLEAEAARKSLKRMRAHNMDQIRRNRTRSAALSQRTSQRSTRKRRARIS
jgi:hypothetical protein